MKQKTFFSMMGVIVILLFGYFTVQLMSMANKACLPEFDFDCEVRAMSECSFEFVSAILFHSWCENGTCYGEWEIYCDKPGGIEFGGFIECSDFFNPYCENN
jgi:hypothetical protein